MGSIDDYDWGNLSKSQAFEILYEEVRAVARMYFRHERPGHTWRPTEVANEAFLRFMNKGCTPGTTRSETLAKISLIIIRVLQDHHRQKTTLKRGGGWQKVTFKTDVDVLPVQNIDFVDLDKALMSLKQSGAKGRRRKYIALFRFVVALEPQQIADLLGVSVDQVEEDWDFARAFLMSHLAGYRTNDPDRDDHATA